MSQWSPHLKIHSVFNNKIYNSNNKNIEIIITVTIIIIVARAIVIINAEVDKVLSSIILVRLLVYIFRPIILSDNANNIKDI